MFDRNELIAIREKAESAIKIKNGQPLMNPTWVRAYQRLADAADHLAMYAGQTGTAASE